MKNVKTRLLQSCVLLGLVLGGTATAQPAAFPGWQEDLEFLVEKLATRHADPWSRVHEPAFRRSVADLQRRIHELDNAAIAVELMRLVASFSDGHTKLLPTGPNGFSSWFPLRLHQFADGLYVTSSQDEPAVLRGARVMRINGLEADDVLGTVTSLFGADNRFGRKSFAFLLTNADLLQAVGIVGAERILRLELERDGRELVREFQPAVQNESMDFRFWGEMFNPTGMESLSSWGGAAMGFLRTAEPQRPLHLRRRNAYYWEYLRDEETVYFQLNAMSAQSSQAPESLMDSWKAALSASRDNDRPAQRFVIDLRYNFGGDGSLVPGLVSELLRGYPFALEQGRVFVVTGGATFSAGIMMVEELLDHVPAILVGEPMGAPFNHFGDAETFHLPHSGYQVDISRRLWQLSESDDEREFIPVQVPAVLTGAQYFDGLDPVMEHILSSPSPYPTLDRVIVEQGSDAAERFYQEASARWGHIDYWQPLGRMDLEYAADRLLEQGRIDDAVTAYSLNTRLFPDDWDTWDDLGAMCRRAERDECVRMAYRRALVLNPSNWNAEQQKEALRELDE